MSLDQKTVQNVTYSALARAGGHLFEKIRAKTSHGSYPEAIGRSMSLGQVRKMKNTYYIDIIFDLKIAPMLLAFEYGSGEHATRGEARRYRIEPKNVLTLAIPEASWEGFKFPFFRGKKMIRYSNGKFLLRYVDHPGIKPHPFIVPTIREERPTLRRLLGDAFRVISHGPKIVEEIT